MNKFLLVALLALPFTANAFDWSTLNPSVEVGYGMPTNGDRVEHNESDASVLWAEVKVRQPVYENVEGYLGLSWLGEGESELYVDGKDTTKEQGYYAYGIWWGVELPTNSRVSYDLGVGIQSVNFAKTGNDVTAGLRAGVEYGITKNWAVNAKYVYFVDGGETDIGVAIAGVKYRF